MQTKAHKFLQFLMPGMKLSGKVLLPQKYK